MPRRLPAGVDRFPDLIGSGTVSGRHHLSQQARATSKSLTCRLLGSGNSDLGVTYTLWIPDGVEKLRGVIVHQHGCGIGACKGGATAAYDLHWQALAEEVGLRPARPVVPPGRQAELPRSGATRATARDEDLPEGARRPRREVGAPGAGAGALVPVGPFRRRLLGEPDADAVPRADRRRLVPLRARRSRPGRRARLPKPELPEAVYAIPMMCNPGAKEKGDSASAAAWTGDAGDVQGVPRQGAPIGFAPDPRTGHECGDCRYLAIPFFDACLAACACRTRARRTRS